MTRTLTASALMVGALLVSAPAMAKGCIKGAIVGGVAGHVVGHGAMGAVAGCVVGRHRANERDRARTTQQAAPRR